MEMVMPHSREAEEVVLGALINDKDKVGEVEESLLYDEFYYDKHKIIYKGILNLRRREEQIDLITLCEELKTMDTLDKVGGLSYISQLSNAATYLDNVKSYSDIIKDRALRRRIIKSCMKAIEESHKDSSMEAVVQKLEENMVRASASMDMEEMEHIMDALQDTITYIENRNKSKKEILGITTGFKELDRVTSGLIPGDFIIIAGRPSMGKTAFALNIAQYASKDACVGIFSLEMPSYQLTQRLLASKCLIPLKNIRSGALSEKAIDKLLSGAEDLSKRKLFIDDQSTTISAIKAKVRALKKKAGLHIIVVDYLQLIEPATGTSSREQEIAKISRELKRLAKSLNITVIALSQLSRAPELRSDSRPMLSDLRESGSIEQDADIVIFPYRESYYDKEAKGEKVEIIIGKNRNGEVTTINLGWAGQYQRFANLL